MKKEKNKGGTGKEGKQSCKPSHEKGEKARGYKKKKKRRDFAIANRKKKENNVYLSSTKIIENSTDMLVHRIFL